MAKHLVCISGSYRTGGATEQALDALAAEADRRGWICQRVRLVDKRIAFCTNCRDCMQSPGAARGTCPIQDDVASVLDAVDQSQALVLASPVNCFDVTAVTRAFLERLAGCAYWPWGKHSPAWRNKKAVRPSVLVTCSAMPASMARFFTRSMKSLNDMSKCLQAKPADRVFLGMVARQPSSLLPDRAVRRVRRAAERLLS